MRRVNGAREREPVSVERIVGRRIDGVELVAVGDGRLAPRLQSLTRISCRKALIGQPVEAPFEGTRDAIGGSGRQAPLPAVEGPPDHVVIFACKSPHD